MVPDWVGVGKTVRKQTYKYTSPSVLRKERRDAGRRKGRESPLDMGSGKSFEETLKN